MAPCGADGWFNLKHLGVKVCLVKVFIAYNKCSATIVVLFYKFGKFFFQICVILYVKKAQNTLIVCDLHYCVLLIFLNKTSINEQYYLLHS